MRRVLVVNGPTLNLLGQRQPEIYGRATLADLVEKLHGWGAELGITIEHFQSNHEGEIIDRLHSARQTADGIVLNPGAFGHYSYALHDAIEATELPVVELHISNIEEREPWRRRSVIRPACVWTIYGRGLAGYRWALRHLHFRAARPFAIHHYGPEADQVGDLRLPDGPGPHPLVVLIHGGFWRHQWTRDLMDGPAVDLASAGVATFNGEYRRLGKGGGWPGTFLDVGDMLAAASSLPSIDLSRVAVVGHSAGGQLAMWAAASRASRADGFAPRLVVGLAAVTDLLRATEEGVGEGSPAALLAGAPGRPTDFSPLHLLPLGVAQLLMVGDSDQLVPSSFSVDYAARAVESGDEVELIEMEGVDHFGLIDPLQPGWEIVRHALTAKLLPSI